MMAKRAKKERDTSNDDIVKKEMAEPRVTKSAKIAQLKLGVPQIAPPRRNRKV
jgi:hypothetical protein